MSVSTGGRGLSNSRATEPSTVSAPSLAAGAALPGTSGSPKAVPTQGWPARGFPLVDGTVSGESVSALVHSRRVDGRSPPHVPDCRRTALVRQLVRQLRQGRRILSTNRVPEPCWRPSIASGTLPDRLPCPWGTPVSGWWPGSACRQSGSGSALPCSRANFEPKT